MTFLACSFLNQDALIFPTCQRPFCSPAPQQRRWIRPYSPKFNAFRFASPKAAHTSKNAGGGREKQKTNRREEAGKGSSAKRKEKASSQVSKHKLSNGTFDKRALMREFAADEKLLFSPVLPSQDAIRCIYAFPNEYAVGICSLGYQLVWAHLASSANVHVARLFTDASEPLMPNPELVGFSLSWELDYANILNMLDDMGIPLLAASRDASHPLVFGGGAVLTANPEPYANFFDVILMGDGEQMLPNFLSAFDATRGGAGAGADRVAVLKALSQVEGVYVPQLYEVAYEDEGHGIASIRPVDDLVPAEVARAVYKGGSLATSTVVTHRMAWENIFMLEVARSCPEMCNFCMASFLTLPFRTPSVANHLIPAIEKGLQYTSRIGLLGASVTQHPEFSDLLSFILQPQFDHVRLSIASVRTNTVTPELCQALAKRGTHSLTIAIESGSPRMRQVVNKKLETEDIIKAAKNAQEGGLQSMKLYSMVGLPSETDDDISATINLMAEVRHAAPRLSLTLGCSTFVPKAQTPFEKYGVRREAAKRLQRLEKAMRSSGVEFRAESFKWSVVQAVLSRGDRRLSKLLMRAREFGASHGAVGRAFKELKGVLPPLDFYVHREIEDDEVVAWQHLKGTFSKQFLRQRAEVAKEFFVERKEASANEETLGEFVSAAMERSI